jgi:TatA/E family protein of Tat protein translocase
LFSHWPYLVLFLVIALIIFGPKRLPELGEGLGKAIREFRKATSDMGNSLAAEHRPVEQPPAAIGTTYAAPTTDAPPLAGQPTVPPVTQEKPRP